MSGLLVTIRLRDAQGKQVELQAPSDVPAVMVGVGPIGCFVFDRTDEHDTLSGARIYQQRLAPLPEPDPSVLGPSSVIDLVTN